MRADRQTDRHADTILRFAFKRRAASGLLSGGIALRGSVLCGIATMRHLAVVHASSYHVLDSACMINVVAILLAALLC